MWISPVVPKSASRRRGIISSNAVSGQRSSAGIAKHATITEDGQKRPPATTNRLFPSRPPRLFRDWLAEYPHGYVLTLRGEDVPPILHRADCPHVSSRRQQHPTTDQCEKRCAPQRATLEQWAHGQHRLPRPRLCVQCVHAGRLSATGRVESAKLLGTRLGGGTRDASVRSFLACWRRCTTAESSGTRHVGTGNLLVSWRENTAHEVRTSMDKSGHRGRG